MYRASTAAHYNAVPRLCRVPILLRPHLPVFAFARHIVSTRPPAEYPPDNPQAHDDYDARQYITPLLYASLDAERAEETRGGLGERVAKVGEGGGLRRSERSSCVSDAGM